MRRVSRIFLLSFMVVLLAACSDAEVVANRTDSDGLIRYAMPDGWTNTKISSGDHYTRVGIEDSPVLGVVARRRTSAPSIQQVQDGTKGKHEMQGHALIKESTRTHNGFTIWETVYEANLRGQEAVLHDVFLFSTSLQVEVNLNAPRQDHDKFVSDLLAVVDSVKANTTEETM